jgi:hypothetical protein
MATESELPQAVVINISPNDVSLPCRKMKGQIQDFANKLLVLLADEEIDVATGITAQGKDLLFLGKVLKSVPNFDGHWAIHIHVNRTILVV